MQQREKEISSRLLSEAHQSRDVDVIRKQLVDAEALRQRCTSMELQASREREREGVVALQARAVSVRADKRTWSLRLLCCCCVPLYVVYSIELKIAQNGHSVKVGPVNGGKWYSSYHGLFQRTSLAILTELPYY